MKDAEREFHELWLGMVQPIEGLVISLPALEKAQCYERQPPSTQHALIALCARDAKGELANPVRIAELPRFLEQFLALTPDLWEASADYHNTLPWGGSLPASLNYYAADGGQIISPSLALKKLDAAPAKADADLLQAAARYELVLWDLPEGLALDKAETQTGPWSYPPSAKLERLLRAAKVPIGLISNGQVLRLLYAPAGESTGHIDFRIADMSTVGGRPILDAMVMLLHARRFFSVAAERALPALLQDSRKSQADVTVTLGKQVLEALTILLRGFEAAAERDGHAQLTAALARGDDHLYQGLLTVLLRLVFVLYAEDRGLLPTDQPLYAQHYSLLTLFAQLQVDHGAYPDSMARRFGAWGRIVALFRALFLGVRAGKLRMPERRGSLFDPNNFAFLEGWDAEGSAPIRTLEAQSEVNLPTIDDETLFEVLRKLILLDGQRLSYRALDVEQIGSVYEGLMGYHVKRVSSDAVCMRPDGVWCSADELLAVPPAQRPAWIADTIGLDKTKAKALAEEVKGLRSEAKVFEVLEGYALGRTKEQRAHGRAHAGQLVLQPGVERRRTSSHYTPRSLSTQVVDRALQPLLATMTPEGADGPPSDLILQLRVCDPAMGSGAFLVEACRYLGDALEAAWRREGTLNRHRDPTLAARRRVAQCCLYGVDKNAPAVELAKLSLWLVTLEQDRPFTFLDCSLRHGDSLVGLSLDQLRAFHWQPSKQLEIDAALVGRELDEAIALRQRLIAMALGENGVNPDPREKDVLRRQFEDAISELRLIADVCVSAFFNTENDKAREQARVARLALVQRWLAEIDVTQSDALKKQLCDMSQQLKQTQTPFHWMLEFPEVFWDRRPDPLENGTTSSAAAMDSFIGNPPFMGGTAVASNHGEAYVSWLKSAFTGDRGNRGQCDMSAFFLRRASELLGGRGTLGLIATKTIAQGDTRTIGLSHLVAEGVTLYGAQTNIEWPGNAAVTISIVHAAKSLRQDAFTVNLNGIRCNSINSYLRSGAEHLKAAKLRASSDFAFNGSKVGGLGFIVDGDECSRLIANHSKNKICIQPCVGGEEVNSSPAQEFSRYAINFGTRTLEEANAWPGLLDIVRLRVKPERDSLPATTAWNRDLKARWWQFAQDRRALAAAIAPLKRCLVTSQVTKHLLFSFQPTDRIFTHTLYVCPLDHYTAFATLQSRIHEPWARLLSSSLEDRLRYSASDCFETFPFPDTDPRTQIPELEQPGKALYEARAQYMVSTNQGLTKTYNALKDPACRDREILKLRELHEGMDRAVLDAYGWKDLKVPPFCPKLEAEQAELKRFEAQVIDRLYALNTERAAEEERLGLANRTKKGQKAKPREKRSSQTDQLSSLALSARVIEGTDTKKTKRAKSSPPAKKKRVSNR